MDTGGLSSKLFVVLMLVVVGSMIFTLYQVSFSEGKIPYSLTEVIMRVQLIGCDKYYGNMRANLKQALLHPAKACVFQAETPGVYEMPEELWQLTGLKQLSLVGGIRSDVTRGNLSSIPPEIGNLTKLQILNLHNNTLSEIPPEIGELTDLEELDLSSNQLEDLPVEIWDLSNLKILKLDFNQFTSLPQEISKLTKLEKLSLIGNNFAPEDIEEIKKLLPNTRVMTSPFD